MINNICPICNAENNCMAHSEKTCWCINIQIPRELLELVPEDQIRKACICLKCIEAFKENPKKFTKEYI